MRALLLVLSLAACATGATEARQVLAGVDTLNAAASKVGAVFVAQCAAQAESLWDQGQRDAAAAKSASCHSAYSGLHESLRASQDAVTAAGAAIDVAEQAQSKDFSSALAPLYGAARTLADMLGQLGVKLPSIPGVI